jgi:hypothetical protein
MSTAWFGNFAERSRLAAVRDMQHVHDLPFGLTISTLFFE